MKPANGQQALVHKPLRITVFLSALIILACALASPAQAAPPYKYERVLSERLSETVPGGAFGTPETLTFDAGGTLFVADGHGVIDRFDQTGAFIEPQLGAGVLSSDEGLQGIAVNDETGHVYAGDANAREVFVLSQANEELSHWTGAGREAGPFGGGGLHVAVDNSSSVSKGDVYVMSQAEGVGAVDVYEPQNGDKEEAKLLRSLKPPLGTFEFEQADGLTVNQTSGQAAGQAYVVDAGSKVVDRFSPTGEFEMAIKGPSPTEQFKRPVGVAIDEATGDVFVVDSAANAVDKFSASGVFLQRITGPGDGFKSPKDVAIQQLGPNAGDVYVSDSEAHVVDVFALEVPAEPSVSEEAAEDVSGDSADLTGEVNPRGARSAYHFDYGACATAETCKGSLYDHSVPVPDGDVGAEEDFAEYSVGPFHIQGLSPSTVYHYRLIATNSHGQTIGQERTFTTQPPGGELTLPDNRLWELVSPPDKHGAVIAGIAQEGLTEAAAAGGAMAYLANAPTESTAPAYAHTVQLLSTRTATGWISRDIPSPHEKATGHVVGIAPEYRFFTPELSTAIIQPYGLFNPTLSSEASEQTPYFRTLGGCESSCYRPLVTAAPGGDVPPGTHFGEEALCEIVRTVCGPSFIAGTNDVSHVVVASVAPLVAGAPRKELYEWESGHLQLISVLPPNGAGEELPAPTGPREGQEPQLGAAYRGAESGSPIGSARRALSSDGARVFWESAGALYVRDTVLHKTLQLDAAERGCGACGTGQARYQIASADGSRVLFTDSQHLTANASATGTDLYECQIAVAPSGALDCGSSGPVDLTPGGAGESTQVQGDVIGATESNDTIYFVADAVLAAGASAGTCNGFGGSAADPRRCNLYVRRDGVTRFIARLSNTDSHDWEYSASQSAQVSPSGQWLAFMSILPLTGYDNHDAVSGEPDAEIYRYDLDAAKLTCASCDPSGARPHGVQAAELSVSNGDGAVAGQSTWTSASWVAALLPGGTAIGSGEPAYQGRYLADSGRVFFNSLGALAPQDVNGTWDVYEQEPVGVGNCQPDSRGFDSHIGGCLGLISSGTSPQESAFLDASETGGDVFFLSSAKLAAPDVDTNYDVYDAHECTTASPCLPPAAVPPPPCNTEASCRPAPVPQPSIFGAPSSATFEGPGNLTTLPTATRRAKPTRHELLLKALRACHKRYPHSKHRRQACEHKTRHAYMARTTATYSARQVGVSTDERRVR